jgi:hypothetical protein
MNKRFKVAFILSIFILLLTPSLLFATDDLYDAAGIDPHRETISSIPEEHIDPFTGGVTLNHIDARLPRDYSTKITTISSIRIPAAMQQSVMKLITTRF